MEKRFAIYTTDNNRELLEMGREHPTFTGLNVDEAASVIKLIANKMDPNKPVNIIIKPYIE